MLSAREAAASLYGAYRLARQDAGGLDYFDTSLEGFWRSFYAAAFIAQPFALLLALRFSLGVAAPSPARYAALTAMPSLIPSVPFPVPPLQLARCL